MDTNHDDYEPDYDDYDAEYQAGVREERLTAQYEEAEAERLSNEQWAMTADDRAKAEAAAHAEMLAVEIPF